MINRIIVIHYVLGSVIRLIVQVCFLYIAPCVPICEEPDCTAKCEDLQKITCFTNCTNPKCEVLCPLYLCELI